LCPFDWLLKDPETVEYKPAVALKPWDEITVGEQLCRLLFVAICLVLGFVVLVLGFVVLVLALALALGCLFLIVGLMFAVICGFGWLFMLFWELVSRASIGWLGTLWGAR
jgi:hypothetical protein